MLSKIDLEFLQHHPLRWIRMFWFHWTFAAAMWGIAWSVTNEVFIQTSGFPLWPILLGGVGAVAATSSLAPFDLRVQAFTGATIFGAATFRALILIEVMIDEAMLSQEVTLLPVAVLWALLLHWIIIAAIGVAWPRISQHAGMHWTIEAGRSDGAQ